MTKRILLMFCVVLAFTATRADYLYWQISDLTVPNAGAGGGTLSGYTTATAYATTGDGSFTALTSYVYGYDPDTDTEGIDSSTGSLAKDVPSGYTYAADISAVNSSDYSFFIELKNGSGNVVGWSNWVNYSDAVSGNYTTTGSLADVPSASIWHGGSYSNSVPEPTSGLLMLLGAACLGLRRKARSVA